MSEPSVGECATATQSSATSPSPGVTGARPVDAWERLGWLMASVWLVFLIFPLYAAAAVPRQWWGKAVAVALVLGFGVYYFWIWRYPRRGRSWWNLGILTALTLISYPLISMNALSMVPFLVAFSAFAFTPQVSYLLLVFWVAATAGALAIFDVGGQWWFMIIPAASVAIMTGLIRFIDDRQQDFQELQDQYVAASERERISRDLHDLLGQSLTAIALKAQVAERLVETSPGRAVAELQEIQALSRRTIGEVRDVVGVLRARDVDGELAAARKVLAAAGVELTVVGTGQGVAARHQQALAWALREAVTNVARHSRAETCTITLAPRSLVVEDDGVGRSGAPPGNGLAGLAERLAENGGTLTVTDAAPGQARPGTRLEVAL